MYEWFTKDRHLDERERQVDDVLAWCIIGAVALATFLVVWVPLLVLFVSVRWTCGRRALSTQSKSCDRFCQGLALLADT